MAPSQAGYAPSLDKLLKSLKNHPLEASIDALIFLLTRRQVHGDDCAIATAHILLQVVARSKWNDVDQLLARVQKAGSRLVHAAPDEPVIGNIVRRVLGLIRDEASEERNADDLSESASDIQTLTTSSSPPPRPPPLVRSTTAGGSMLVSKSMFNLLSVADPADLPTGASTPVSQAQPASIQALRSEVIDGIEEIMDEISQADDQIASFAEIQINPGDYVLVYRPSKTVEKFLVKAASKRRFTVFIAGLEPHKKQGAEAPYAALRKKLNAAGVNTVNLASNGLTAYMARVSKVVISAKAVYQNGGLLVDSGSCIAVQAAEAYSKPVIVLCGVYKFCPQDPSEELSSGGVKGNSSAEVSYAEGAEVDELEVENTVTDYVRPEHVDIYLTNLGPQTLHHFAGILADHYKPEEMLLSLQLGEA
ncbi:hypothetical protein B0T24DRAFT_394825 [Lasiosphaeria ovina]|uniref:Translation initiation factor eIF2B subunit beta n=1 Tax=Lasiosphaeria ovina TaxID=92902 RepID=A0AAE0JWJ9_9PEZI|nr:hypothetical protein B0T24DRAFT_394825 [Lasiosphaeria ovina]